MNQWQTALQLRHLLRKATWPDAPGELVFGTGAYITAGITEETLEQLRAPLAFIVPSTAKPDGEQLLRDLMELEVHLLAEVHGDFIGESALIGGPRSASGQGSSAGRGLMELEEIMHAAITRLNEADGVELWVAWTGGVAPVKRTDPADTYAVSRAFRLEALGTVERTYPVPKDLAAVDDGDSNNVSLSWVLPPDRFDRREVVLRRATGTTPPPNVTAGVGVTLSGLLATSVTNSTGGADTYSYSLFTGYDELGAGASDRFSPAATVTVVVA